MKIDAASERLQAYSSRYRAVAAFLLLLVVYHVEFGHFFPNRNGGAGHDYSLALPGLLAGYYWFRLNGLGEVPWFTPAFCGGQPFFADPQSGYYSVLQLLTLVTDPLTSSYLTTLLFAAIGYWGCYFLLRRSFSVNQHSAILGAAIFMLNGFSAHRAIVGHLGYHGFMLVPWLAYVLVVPLRNRGQQWLGNAAAGCLAGLIAAYWVQSGLGTLLIPAGLAVALLLLLYALWNTPFPAVQVLKRSMMAAFAAGALSASKLVAAFSFLSNFPRSDYLLPGYRSVVAAAEIAFYSLFISPSDIERRSNEVIENVQWAIGRHELEYGVTVVPLLVMLAGLGIGVWRLIARRSRIRLSSRQSGLLVLIGLIVLLPLALNTYAPEWNALLKHTPLLKSASTFVRWFCLYVPFLAALSALILHRFPARLRVSAAVVGFGLLVVFNLTQDRTEYALQSYRPDAVINAYRAFKSGAAVPTIQDIGVNVDARRRIVLPGNRNEALTQNMSQLFCYNPVFGYTLEKFPIGDLHPGPVREVRDGHYNVKNPACYVFPMENGCSPGDHFRVDQTEAMENFVRYRPFAFGISEVQKIANRVTLSGLVVTCLVLVGALGVGLYRVIARRERSGGSGLEG